MEAGPCGLGKPANNNNDDWLLSGATWLKNALTLGCLSRSHSRKFCLNDNNSAFALYL